ncbi:ABC transporter permease [Lysinibacillus sp. 54212]|uniref:ABC transporter permease n=1 Tax=Lysinibacillus sp. 54212 TaxID=3119829 RepID=UPI002FC8598F
MNTVLFTRWLHVKKHLFSTLLWIFSPIFLTLLIYQLVMHTAGESKIPIAVVDEDKSQLSEALIEQIQAIPYLHVSVVSKREALYQLEKYELDSVFVIKRRYEEQLDKNKRNRLIEAYSTNRSYAYFAVVESISSLAQEDASRAKAAYEVRDLIAENEADLKWSFDEIVLESKERQERTDLLQTSFQYSQAQLNNLGESNNKGIWGLWAFLSLLTTFYLFDWLVKEKGQGIKLRWTFAKISFWHYAVTNLILYTLVLLLIDGTMVVVTMLLGYGKVSVSFLLSLILYRLIINLFSFCVAFLFNNTVFYYLSALVMSLLLAILGGAFMPMDSLVRRFPLVEQASPIYGLLNQNIPYVWCLLLLFIGSILYIREVRSNA